MKLFVPISNRLLITAQCTLNPKKYLITPFKATQIPAIAITTNKNKMCMQFLCVKN